jgi:hypothetical protein
LGKERERAAGRGAGGGGGRREVRARVGGGAAIWGGRRTGREGARVWTFGYYSYLVSGLGERFGLGVDGLELDW